MKKVKNFEYILNTDDLIVKEGSYVIRMEFEDGTVSWTSMTGREISVASYLEERYQRITHSS